MLVLLLLTLVSGGAIMELTADSGHVFIAGNYSTRPAIPKKETALTVWKTLDFLPKSNESESQKDLSGSRKVWHEILTQLTLFLICWQLAPVATEEEDEDPLPAPRRQTAELFLKKRLDTISERTEPSDSDSEC